MQWRLEAKSSDVDHVARIARATGYFRPEEVDVAVELIETTLAQGPAAGYEFIFAERAETLVGYCCYGQIACTLGSYDLYWIMVDPAQQRNGIGRQLLAHAEQLIWSDGGRHIYIETSGRDQYADTRAFYLRCGYSAVATLPDFYDRGDDKVIFRKGR